MRNLGIPFQQDLGVPVGLSSPKLSSGHDDSTLLTGLVAWYALGEASGQRNDSHTNALHLTDYNTVTQAAGAFPGTYAAQFTATNSEKLECADDPVLHIGPNYTLAACLYLVAYPGNFVNAGLVMHAVGGPTWEGYEMTLFDVGANDWRIGGYCGDDTGAWNQVLANAIGKPALATWYKVITWRDESAQTLNIQVNGGAVESVALTSNLTPSTSRLRLGVGYDGAQQYLDGRLQNVGIWNRALLANERTSYVNGVTYPFT